MTRNSEISVTQGKNHSALVKRSEGQTVTPVADIIETADSFVVMLDMPGTTKDAINVSVDQNTLSVSGSVEPYHKPGAMLLFNEIPGRGYYRAFNLGKGIDRNNIDAQFEHGVLTIKLFKRDDLKPKEIKIN